MAGDDFGAKLTLVLKALTLSNGRVAAALAVDKSLVGRWVAGSVRPSAYNLARLTAYLATLAPGLTLLDWDLPVAELRRVFETRIGTAPPTSAIPPAIAAWLTDTGFGEAAAAASDGRALTGFWRTTRPSPELPGRYLHDAIRITPAAGGAYIAEVISHSARMKGWAICVDKQMFICVTDVGSGFTYYLIVNHLGLDRVEVMDGIVSGALRGGGGSPTATPIIMTRVGDISGDSAADEARLAAMLGEPHLAPEGSVPARVVRHLASAMAADGVPVIAMPSMTSIARARTPLSEGPALRVVAAME